MSVSKVEVEPAVTADLYVSVLQFLYREAALLDRGDFDAWIGLLHEDIVYDMPLTLTRDRSESDRVHDEVMEFFAENLASLEMRVKRLHTEYAWAEDPPTRTRHMVSNAIVQPGDGNELVVDCAFSVHANRGNQHTYDVFVGSRRDILIPDPNTGFKLRHRRIWLDQAVVGANSISIFL